MPRTGASPVLIALLVLVTPGLAAGFLVWKLVLDKTTPGVDNSTAPRHRRASRHRRRLPPPPPPRRPRS